MSFSVVKIIKGALRLNGNPNPDSEDTQFALDALNMWLDFLGANDYNIFVNTKEELTLVASQATYTLGTGGDLNSARPLSIVDIYFQQSGETSDTYVLPITEPEYDDITDKTTEGRPTMWFMAPEFPLAKLYLSPVPDAADTLKITSRKPFTAVTLTDSFSMPAGYDRMMKYNLALELAPEDGMAVDPLVLKNATESLNEIKRKNGQPLRMVSDSPRGLRTKFKRPFNINILE